MLTGPPTPEFLESIRSLKIDLLVIDEAHCISQWGHDFRPAYLTLAEAWKALGKPLILALTATATEEVIADIKTQLGLPQMRVFSSGVLRRNLFYQTLLCDKEADKMTKVLELLQELSGSGIIYCATVKSAERIYETLQERGYPVDLYHGKLGREERQEHRLRFMQSPPPDHGCHECLRDGD